MIRHHLPKSSGIIVSSAQNYREQKHMRKNLELLKLGLNCFKDTKWKMYVGNARHGEKSSRKDKSHCNGHRFFQAMWGYDFQTELRIPRKFKDEFKGELLDDVNLRGPSGNIWTTKLVLENQDLFLRHGWEIFAKDHALNLRDLLVFQYFGKSLFDVLIFDATGCEREGSYVVETNPHSTTGTKHCCSLRESTIPHINGDQGQRDYMTSLSPSDDGDESKNNGSFTTNKFPASLKRKWGTHVGDFSRAVTRQSDESKMHDYETTDTSEKIEVPLNANFSEESSIQIEILVDDQEDHRPFSGDSYDRNLLNNGNRIRYLVSSRRNIKREEEIAVIEKAMEYSCGVGVAFKKNHKSKLPSCLIVMKPSHVSHGFALTIPKRFADLYLPKESQGIMLRVPPCKKTWQVQFKRWKQQCTLNKGWAEFVYDLNLEVSDVCVLALSEAKKSNKTVVSRVIETKNSNKNKGFVLNVTIFRVVEDFVRLKVC